MPGPRDPEVWGPAAIALVALTVDPVKAVVRPALTAVHEAGHVVAAMATGRVVRSVTVESDGYQSFGGTRHVGGVFGRTLTSVSGYPAPSAAGLGFAYLLHQKYPPLGLFVAAMIFFGLLFLLVRNPFGLLVVGGLAFAAYAVVYRAGPHLQLQAARTVTWLLLLGGVDGVLQLREARASGNTSDADSLWEQTFIPAIVWEAAFLFGTWVALVYGIQWMFT